MVQHSQGNIHNFKDGLVAFGSGAVAGAQIASLFLGLPTPNIGLGISFGRFVGLKITPTFVNGTEGIGVGLNIGLGIGVPGFELGASYGFTYYPNYSAFQDGFLEQRFSYGVKIGTDSYNLNYGSTTFRGGGVNQRTVNIGFTIANVNINYENDFMFGLGGDGGDRWRSAALKIGYKEKMGIGFNLITGNPGYEDSENGRPREIINGHGTYTGEHSNDYRMGALFAYYGNYRVGVNAEPVRHVIQNRFAHDIMTGGHSKWFQVMNKTWYPYFSYKTRNPYTLW